MAGQNELLCENLTQVVKNPREVNMKRIRVCRNDVKPRLGRNAEFSVEIHGLREHLVVEQELVAGFVRIRTA